MDEKLGYYTVDNQKFESKIQALIYATKFKKPVRWVFNNRVFDYHNWKLEPAEDLDTLYRRRARELREKYDYLVLCYSGGSDSNNILEAFIQEGLVIDEIVTNFIVDATKPITNQNLQSTKAENHNAEWDLLTSRRMQYIYDNMKGVKISNFDMSRPILEHFKSHQDGSWILKCKEWANPMSTARYNIIHDTALRKKFDATKSVGVILGVDKPQLTIRDKKLYLYFSDTTANITPMTGHIKTYDNSTVEFFYWSPDSANILCKQAHIMLKYLRQFEHHQRLWDWTTNLKTSPLYNKARTLRESILRTVIYTTWNQQWFQAEKGTIGWTNVNDRWFFDYFKGTAEYQAWQNGIDYMLQNISSDFMVLEDQKFVPMFSPNYYIGNLDNSQ